MREALSALPGDQRHVFELGYHGGLSASEIAARVNVPIGTVKSRLAAAVARLRAALRVCARRRAAPRAPAGSVHGFTPRPAPTSSP